MLKPSAALAVVVFLWHLPTPSAALDENEVVMKLRNAAQQGAGASGATQQRIAERLHAEIFGKPIEVASVVIQNIVEDRSAGGNTYLQGTATLSTFPAPQVRGTWATATKSYQDLSIHYWVLLDSEALIDNCRTGQTVSFTGVINSTMGDGIHLYDEYRTGAALNGTLVITNAHISTETRMLRCANGHEYAPSAGYKFCPQDGLPLR